MRLHVIGVTSGSPFHRDALFRNYFSISYFVDEGECYSPREISFDVHGSTPAWLTNPPSSKPHFSSFLMSSHIFAVVWYESIPSPSPTFISFATISSVMDLPETLQVGEEVDLTGSAKKPPAPSSTAAVVYNLISLHPDPVERKVRSLSFDPSTDVQIGRDKTVCQLHFEACAVLSRTHCRIFSIGRDVFLHDFSSNGTFINGKAIGKGSKHLLRAGDTIAVVQPRAPDGAEFSWKFVPPPEEEKPASVTGVNGAYTLGKVLGTGNFATVRLGTSKTTAKEVAVKIIEKKRFALTQSDFSFSSLIREVDILRRMHHKNIIAIHDVYDDPQTFTMVLELVRHGDLFDYIVGRCPQPFEEADAKKLFVQLVEAMLYMHSKNVVHRDLKPENILVSVDPTFVIPGFCDDNQRNARNIPVDKVTLKITDFGLAKFCSEHDMMTTMCGTPSYLAPEVLVPSKTGEKKAEGYSWGVDVWSLGVILYILLSGTPPKDPQCGKIVFNKYFANVSNQAQNLVVGMLKTDARERYDLNDIVTHPWLAGCKIEGKELAIKKAPTLTLQGTVLAPIVVAPTVQINTEGGDTDLEDSDNEAPGTRKRPRTDEPTSKKIVVVWSWKKNLDKDDKDETAWEPYSLEECTNIEKAQQKGSRSCKVGDGTYRISFEGMFQYKKMDTSKQRPVRRVEKEVPVK
jgi:serine/threonine protein kinase